MLAHEDEHVQAHDPWLLSAATALLVLAPWNLVLWWQLRRLRLAVEMDCDARVLARGGAAPAYGDLLLRVGRRRARLPLGAPALGEPASFLARRIRRMATALPRWRWAGATAAGLVAAAAIIAACEAPRPVGLKSATEPSAVAKPAPGPYTPGTTYLQALTRQYHPEVFAHPVPGAAVAFVFDARDSVVGHAAGVRESRDHDCLAVVDRLIPAFHTSEWSSGGCAEAADNGKVVVYWKTLKQAQVADDVSTESMVDERPVFLSGPPLQYPALLRQAGIQGTVLVRAIIDTTGRAEPASVRVIESPHPGFDQAARNFVLHARILPRRVHGRAVRTEMTFPITFSMRE
jgi:TonB family protein